MRQGSGPSLSLYGWRWPCLAPGLLQPPPRRRRPNRQRRPDAGATGSTADHQGKRKGFEAESGWERRSLRSRAPQWWRARWLRRLRATGRLGASGGQTLAEGIASGSRCERGRLLERSWPDACRGRPVQRGQEVNAGTNTRSFQGGRSRFPPPRGEGRGKLTRYSTRWRGAAGTSPPPRPRLDRRTACGEPCGRGWAVPDTPLHVRSPQSPTRVRLRSFAQDPWREIRESLPATLIVTARGSDPCLGV